MGAVRAVKGQVHLERQMDVHRASQKRKHAERESHQEADQVKIGPGHKTPPKTNGEAGARRDGGRKRNNRRGSTAANVSGEISGGG